MIRALAIVLACAVVVLVAFWVFQRSLIYLPSGRIPPPSEVGLPTAEPVEFTTADGVQLAGWFVPPPDGGPGPAVLVFNGNAANRAARAPLAAALAEAGLGVLLFDYRGYGGNEGSPSEVGLLADARAARETLLARPEVDPERLVYYGESLGAGVATALAVDHPPAALVLRSPFTSLADVGRVHYPFLPVNALLRDRYPVAEQMAAYSGPLLVVAGAEDEIVPTEQSRRVAEAGGGRFVVIDGASHNDPALLDGERLVAEVTTFLRDVGVLSGR